MSRHASRAHDRVMSQRRTETHRPKHRPTRPILVKESAQADLVAEANLALASDILELPSAYFVGKRKPLSELPWLWRWLIRLVYWKTGWASDYGLESQAIATSREMAEALCATHPNWFMQELPVNTPLPDETCTFKLMTFPESDAAKGYEKRAAPFVAIPISEHRKDLAGLKTVEDRLGQLEDLIIEGKTARAL